MNSLKARIEQWLYENGSPPAECTLEDRAKLLLSLDANSPTRRHMGLHIAKMLGKKPEELTFSAAVAKAMGR